MDAALSPVTNNWTVVALARLLLTTAILLGLAILIGGDMRFAGPSYADLAYTPPAAALVWGWSAVFLGLAGLIGSLRKRPEIVRWTLFPFAGWASYFATTFFMVALHDPNISLTRPVVYTFFTVAAIILAVAHEGD